MRSYHLNFLFFIAILMCWACSDNKNSNQATQEEVVRANRPALFTEEIKSFKSPSCSNDTASCSQVNLRFPEFEVNVGALTQERLNEDIQNAMLNSSLNPERKFTTIKDASDGFLKDYAEFSAKIPGQVPAWEIDIEVDVINNDNSYLSIMVSDYAYLGGAHPNQSSHFLNYDVSSGQPITLSSVVDDLKVLKKKAEMEFRASKNLSEKDDLNEAGFLFDNGEFQLPKNFGIQNGQLLLYYNSYEIAAYAEGKTIIKLPLNK